MTRFERENLKIRLLKLIGLRSTGTPSDLAALFGISERSVKRMIRELREEGYKVMFWYPGGTYIFCTDYPQDIEIDQYYHLGVN